MANRFQILWNRILRLPVIRIIIIWSKRKALPGFSGVPIYNILRFVSKEFLKDDITTRANSAAYSFFIALFPLLIFLFTLIPLIPYTADYASMINANLKEFLPETASVYLIDIINDIAAIKREGLLSLGFILALVFGSNGMVSLMKGFDKSYDISFDSRGFLKNRAIAVFLTVLLSILLLISLILVILGKQFLGSIINLLDLDEYGTFAFSALRWIVVLTFIYSGMTFIYKFGPSMKRKINFFNPGSSLATLFIILSSVGFAYFINNFGRYNELYGSIGALIVIMIWLQLSAFIILTGFELNAAIAVNRDLNPKQILKPKKKKNI